MSVCQHLSRLEDFNFTSTETCRVGCVFLLFLDGVAGNPAEEEKARRVHSILLK